MFMILMEQLLMQESPDALWLITLHLENSEMLLPAKLVATILPAVLALKKNKLEITRKTKGMEQLSRDVQNHVSLLFWVYFYF